MTPETEPVTVQPKPLDPWNRSADALVRECGAPERRTRASALLSPPEQLRKLIVNADDFGLSLGTNEGIASAHERGIVTSASLMVRGRAATEAADYARKHPPLSVGLHVDLCEWTFSGGAWRPVYQVVPTQDAEAVANEVARQLTSFRELIGRCPTHLDSHQHVHREEPVHSILLQTARELGIVLRGETDRVRYCGDFYGQSNKGYPFHEAISVASLCGLLHNLPPGITELGCHPGQDGALDSVYNSERRLECQTLCDPAVAQTLGAEGIILCSFRAAAPTLPVPGLRLSPPLPPSLPRKSEAASVPGCK
jgi:chitin disaccharide deacetylase